MREISAADPHPRRRVPVRDAEISYVDTGRGQPIARSSLHPYSPTHMTGAIVEPSRYHPALVALHWFLAAFISLALGLGMFVLKTIPNSSLQKIEALRAHMIGGVLILTLMIARFVIRVLSAKPAPATTGNAGLDRIAKISHLGFYGLVAAMAITGLSTALLADLPSILFGGSGAPLPESFMVYPTRVIHGVIAKVLVALISVHVAAALYHHFIRGDGLIKRMWFGRRWRGPMFAGADRESVHSHATYSEAASEET